MSLLFWPVSISAASVVLYAVRRLIQQQHTQQVLPYMQEGKQQHQHTPHTPHTPQKQHKNDDDSSSSSSSSPLASSLDQHSHERELPKVSLKELAQHASRKDCWMSIGGRVYDVTSFLKLHPGGSNIMMDYAGKVATASFLSRGHSQTAIGMLNQYKIGILDNGRDHERRVSLGETGERWQLTGGVTHETSPTHELWDVKCRGFLPSRDPLKRLSAPFDILSSLVDQLPGMCADGSVRVVLESKQQEIDSLLPFYSNLSVDEKERAHSILGYLSLGYVRIGGRETLPKLPRFLAQPWCLLSRMLSRRPMLDYSGCSLYNWERLNPSGPITMENIRLLHRFTGLIDEEHFFKTHIVLESEATPLVSGILNAHVAFLEKDSEKLSFVLSQLESAMFRLARVCLPLMFQSTIEQGGLCDYYVFFHELRYYLTSWEIEYEGEFEGQKVKQSGPSGAMSSILPMIDALLGVQMTNEQLAGMLHHFEEYNPLQHRQALAKTREIGSIRSYVHECGVKGDLSIVSNFNSCVRRVVDFRWRHLQFIQKYIMDQTPNGQEISGTGGTHAFRYLYEHINDTTKSLISLSNGNNNEQKATYSPVRTPSRQLSSSFRSTRNSRRDPGYWAVGQNGFLSAYRPVCWSSIVYAPATAAATATSAAASTSPSATAAAANAAVAVGLENTSLFMNKEEVCVTLHSVMRSIPAMCVARGSYCTLVWEHESEWANLLSSLSSDTWTPQDLERAHSCIAFISCAYFANAHETGFDKPLPPSFASARSLVARKTDRPVALSYTDLVLNNWIIIPDIVVSGTPLPRPTSIFSPTSFPLATPHNSNSASSCCPHSFSSSTSSTASTSSVSSLDTTSSSSSSSSYPPVPASPYTYSASATSRNHIPPTNCSPVSSSSSRSSSPPSGDRDTSSSSSSASSEDKSSASSRNNDSSTSSTNASTAISVPLSVSTSSSAVFSSDSVDHTSFFDNILQQTTVSPVRPVVIPPSLKLIGCFLGSPTESHFWRLHILLEYQAKTVLAAMSTVRNVMERSDSDAIKTVTEPMVK